MSDGEASAKETQSVTLQINEDSQERGRQANEGGRKAEQWEINYLSSWRKKYQEADGNNDDPDVANHEKAFYVLHAATYCAESGIAMPVWLAEAFWQRTRPWLSLEVGTLDASFGIIPQSDTKARTYRKNYRIRKRIFAEIAKLKTNGEPVPWDDLANRFGAGKTHLQELYYREKRLQEQEASR